jgi:hypothetical protein
LLLLAPESEAEGGAKETLIEALNARGRIPPALFRSFAAGELGRVLVHLFSLRLGHMNTE